MQYTEIFFNCKKMKISVENFKGRSRINHMGGGGAAAFLFFYAWSGSTEFVFNAWWGFQNNLFYTWSVFPEGTRKYLCGGASFRPIVLDRNVN